MNAQQFAKQVAAGLPLDDYNKALPETIAMILEVVRAIMDMVDDCRDDDQSFGATARQMAEEMSAPDGSFRSRVRRWMLNRRLRRELGRSMYMDLGGPHLQAAFVACGRECSETDLEALHEELCGVC